MNVEMIIGETIRSLRKSQGLFAKTVAARVPMSAAYLCEIENGFHAPSITMLSEIAKGLGMTITDLWFAIYENMEQNA
jgi:transcriptional regulator with XRE-family HTH domain